MRRDDYVALERKHGRVVHCCPRPDDSGIMTERERLVRRLLRRALSLAEFDAVNYEDGGTEHAAARLAVDIRRFLAEPGRSTSAPAQKSKLNPPPSPTGDAE
jgi:hypothetical protein